MSEKEIKEEFRRKAQEEPEKHYPVRILREEGFVRRRCVKCGNYFWSAAERRMCGEPDCAGGYTFIGDTPAKKKMDFIQTWKKFSKLFKKFGYAAIPRYPVVARWRDDTDFVQASIYDFQPFVVSGEVDPPANPLVVPQFCLRFNDTDNVGITGRHYTGFVMIGQHAFAPPEKYMPNDYLEHIYAWLTKGMKIPKEELQFHEDAWSGGGNMGPSMEFFSRGLEIGNQVYIQYDIKSGAAKELSIKVLDMGMGQERPAWFTLATGTSYGAVFPTVAKKLYRATGIEPDEPLLRRFLPYSGLLNIDGKELDKTWAEIAAKIGTDLEELKNHILPLAGIYSIGDHTRSLLFALSDGALPSNVGGGYNLRVLVRRSLDFVARYGWDISLPQVCEWHARYLKPQYPELMDHLDEVNEILEVEQRKYRETKEKSKRIVASLRGKEISLDKLIELYDSNGISPEMLKKEGLKIEIPVDFYTRVAERHEKEREEIEKFREFDSRGIDKTEILYYSDYRLLEFSARVLRIFENEYVVLDKTAFYPTSGGQASDRGYMNGCRVVDVFKQGNMVIHHVENPSFREGEVVACKIDWERRRQLAQHHTATHIINGVVRSTLGEHVWQAGAEKTLEKARLDITHYEALSEKILEKIRKRANEIVAKNLKVESRIYGRKEAEAKFGFRLYQGGAVPGRELRVVSINSLDTEACGGTHLHSTGEVELIEIICSTKIQDGVVRLEYAAGEAARNYLAQESKILQEVLSTAAPHSPNLSKATPEQLRAAAEVFSVPREELPRTIKKFVREILALRKEVGEAQIAWKGRKLQDVAQEIFGEWKELRKRKERAIARKASFALNAILSKPPEEVRGIKYRIEELEAGMEETIKAASELLKVTKVVVLFGTNDRVAVVGMCDESVDIDMAHVVREACRILGGRGGGKPSFAQGAGTKKEKIEEARQFVRKYIREKK
ncbi:MAG: alanine--tRNA ligase [Methanobacteriota archaeon]